MAPPCVAIVGRPNVGKSSLFNAMYGSRVAIVEPTPGVTRDRISRMVEGDGYAFELIDTGGVGLHDVDELADDVQIQIGIAIDQADLVLLIVDAKQGLHPVDADIARKLRDAGKAVMLVANKCDRPGDESAMADFYSLGFPEVHPTSAAHRRGVQNLLDEIVFNLPQAALDPRDETETEEPMKIALVGRRNVGKSTLINCLAQAPRVVVSEIPGTTRDSIDVRFHIDGRDFIAIDTAGLRRRKQIKNNIDFYSTARAKAAIRRADVVIHMMEAPMEAGRLDKQLAREIVEACKPCVLAVNKMDLAGGATFEKFETYIRSCLPGVAYAPLVCISAETGHNVMELVEMAEALHQQGGIRVSTSDVNKAVRQAVKRRQPPSSSRRQGHIYYATQADVRPPTVVLFANEPALIDDNYLRYLANFLRRRFGYSSIPIRFRVRGRDGRPTEGRDDDD